VALLLLVLFNMVVVKIVLGNNLLSDGTRIKYAGKEFLGSCASVHSETLWTLPNGLQCGLYIRPI
jgi:hypothetical protein